MSIIKNSKNTIGGYKHNSPIIKICKGNYVVFTVKAPIEDYNVDLEFDDLSYAKFYLNGEEIIPTSLHYQMNYTDTLTSFSFKNSGLNKINKFPNTSNVTSLYESFSTNIIDLDISDWDLSSVTDATYAFYQAFTLHSVNLGNNLINLDSLEGLFGNCQMLEEVQVDYPNNYQPKNTKFMFANCYELESINFPNLSNVEDASYMFSNCRNLNSLTAYIRYSPNLTNARAMFKNCQSLPLDNMMNEGKMDELITYRCKDVSYMFDGCNFSSGAFDNWHITNSWGALNGVEEMEGFLANTNIGYANFGTWDFWQCWNFQYLFQNCTNMYECRAFENKDLYMASDFSYMFDNCYNLQTVSFEGCYNVNPNITISGMFQNCWGLNRVTCSDDTMYWVLYRALEWSGMDTSILVNVNASGGDKVGDRLAFVMSDWAGANFYINDTEYNFYSSDTDELYYQTLSDMGIETCESIFIGGSVKHFISIPDTKRLELSWIDDLKQLNLSNFNLNGLEWLGINENYNLRYVDLSNWTEFNCWSYGNVFGGCSELKVIKMLNCCDDAKNWVRERLEENGMYDVIIIDENNDNYVYVRSDSYPTQFVVNYETYYIDDPNYPFDTSSYFPSLESATINEMFYGNYDLETVFTIPSLEQVGSHYRLFYGSHIKYIDASSYKINKDAQDYQREFADNYNLIWVNMSYWNLDDAYDTDYMFQNCDELKYVFAFGCSDTTIEKIRGAVEYNNWNTQLIY